MKTKKNPEDIKNKYLLTKYGIRLNEWEEMFKTQGRACWICGRQSGRLCVDHRHVAGYKKFSESDKRKEVRGILCFLCNTGLKGFEKTNSGIENRKRLEGTYKYFQKYRLKGET